MRELKTAVEIQAEVSRLIGEALSEEGSQSTVQVGKAVRLYEPSASGCNWYLDYFSNARDHLVLVGKVLVDVKGRWNLAEGPVSP